MVAGGDSVGDWQVKSHLPLGFFGRAINGPKKQSIRSFLCGMNIRRHPDQRIEFAGTYQFKDTAGMTIASEPISLFVFSHGKDVF